MPSSAADASTLTSLPRTASAEGFAFLFQTRAGCLSRVTTPGPGLRPPPLPAGTPGILWFNHRRLHGEIGLVPPVEFEAQHHHTTPAQHPAPREIHVFHQTGYLTGRSRCGRPVKYRV